MRSVLAYNVTTLRDEVYSHLRTVTARNDALGKDADTTLSQIQRIINQSVGTSIDQLDLLARALKCRPFDLLTPYFQRGSEQAARGEAPPKSDNGAATG